MSDENCTERSSKPSRWPQYLAAVIANIGAFSIGTLFGWTAQASPRIALNETGVPMTESELSWVAGAMPLGAAVTPLLVPFLIDNIGRKNTLLSVVLPFVGGFALLAWAHNPMMYYAGRFVCGLCGGAFSIVTPVYTAEIGEKVIRGTMGFCYELLVSIGLQFVFIVGGVVSVFWSCIICGMIPIIFAVLFFAMPESPYYYISKGKSEEARAALQWLRGKHYDVSQDLKEIEQDFQNRNIELSWNDFKTTAAKKSIMIALGLMLFQQFTGVNAISFNTTHIFQLAGSHLEPSTATMIVGTTFVVNCGSTLLVDRLGRRVLLLTSGIVITLCLTSLGTYFYLLNTAHDVSSINWLPLMSMCIFMAMFATGWGPVTWLMMGELFPTRIKGTCSSVACFVNWFLAFVVSKFYPDIAATFGDAAAFWFFSVISAFGVIFVYILLPETKGKSLQEIQDLLSGNINKNDRHLS